VILAAALLVLVALGLFVGGVATGLTSLYWICVVVSAVAAVLLVVARRGMTRSGAGRPGTEPAPARGAGTPAVDARAPRAEEGPVADVTPAGATARRARAPEAEQSEQRATEHTEASAAPARHSSTAEFPIPARTAENGSDGRAAVGDGADPAVEEVEVTDLLLVVDLTDDVFVVDEHPRYHLADCRWLAGRTAIPLPMDEARTDGFTPCAVCAPDRHMAQVARARKASE
jgi:hypothetical protein